MLLLVRLLPAAVGVFLIFRFDNALVVVVGSAMLHYQVVAITRLARYSTRLGQPGAAEAMATDPRPPILFLRSFGLDELPVSPIDDGVRGLLQMISVEKRTFEERLQAAFEDLGPIIAIGRPGEDAPPLGAAREYADDASWQQLVLERAGSSRLVIMECDGTPGMEWELEHVPRRVGLQRILIVLPPGEDIYEELSPAWYERWERLRRRFGFLPVVSKETVAILFDRRERPIVVSSDDSSVQKRLAKVKAAWLENEAAHEQEADR
jgi:hypothetical protein